MTHELLPCPFCGSEPWGIFGPEPVLEQWWVECHGPDMNTTCGDWYCTVDSDDPATARAEVAAAWNRRAHLQHLPLTGREPEGWKLVPVEPTEKMLAAGEPHMDGMSHLGDAWDAMLSAAPSTDKEGGGEGGAAGVPEAHRRQYYCRVLGCTARDAKDAECVCWHDAGTGPWAQAKPDDMRLEWRDAPGVGEVGRG